MVFGAGPIGIGAYLGLRALGLEDVVVVEPATERRDAVGRLGAEQRDRSDGTDELVGELAERWSGSGARVVIDAAGVPASFRDALAVAGPRARVVTVAAYIEPVSYNPTDVMMREIEIISSFAYCGEFAPVIDHMAAGRYPTEGWVERLPFEEQHLAYERLHRGEAIKLLVDLPDETTMTMTPSTRRVDPMTSTDLTGMTREQAIAAARELAAGTRRPPRRDRGVAAPAGREHEGARRERAHAREPVEAVGRARARDRSRRRSDRRSREGRYVRRMGVRSHRQPFLADLPVLARGRRRRSGATTTTAMMSSSFAPSKAVCERVDGGYHISGRWPWSSGSKHCAWAMVGIVVPPSGPDEMPDLKWGLLPQPDYRVDDDWLTVGMRGTGSNTLIVDDAFVPDHRCINPWDVERGERPGCGGQPVTPVPAAVRAGPRVLPRRARARDR